MRILVAVSAVLLLTNCAVPRRQHGLIDLYSRAACVPLAVTPTVQPPVREWNATLQTADRRLVRVSGWQAATGRIVAHDDHGLAHVVADAGDYVYPADVRTSPDGNTVYVKATGLAGGLFDQTWLFAYDIAKFKPVDKIRVDPDALPPECSGSPAGS